MSLGDGRYCCQRCHEKPGKHGSGCERVLYNVVNQASDVSMEKRVDPCRGEHSWQLARYGTMDIELHVNVKLPIPTFLIPLTLVRWVVPKLVRLVYPYLLLLNERFERTPFAERVRNDRQGYYRDVARTLDTDHRPYNISGKPTFVSSYCYPCGSHRPSAVPAGTD